MSGRHRTLCVCCQPEGAGSELLELARTEGFATINLPLVSLQPVEAGVQQAWRFFEQNRERIVGVIFSSKTAVKAAKDLLGGSNLKISNLKIFAVGAKTARELEAYGNRVDLVGESGLESLYQKILENNAKEIELIHLCGELSVELPKVQHCVVYRTIDRELTNSLKDELVTALSEYEDIYWLFTNARSVVRLRELICSGDIGPPSGVGVAIGASTLSEITKLGFSSYLVAERPSTEGVIEQVIRAVGRSAHN